MCLALGRSLARMALCKATWDLGNLGQGIQTRSNVFI